MADIKVRIIAEDKATDPLKQTGKALDDTAKKAKEAGGAFEGLGKTMMSVAGGLGLQMGLQAVVGGLKNAVVGSFELAAALEQTTVGFTTMLGSGEAASAMLGDLRDFAATTPFQFTDLTQAASRMIAMGTAAEDVIPTLTAVGDAAAGLGLGKAGIDRITLALGQMGAKGKIGGDDLRQLAEAGVPALKYLADAAGVTTAEMSKMIEKGVVPAAEGVDVLVASMSADFGGLMAEQAKTATGALSNLEDTVATLGTEVGEMFLPAVSQAAAGLSEFLAEILTLQGAVSKEKDVLSELQDAVSKGLITQDQYNEVTKFTTIAVDRAAQTLAVMTDEITDMDAATRLATAAEEKAAEQYSISRQRLQDQGEATDDLRAATAKLREETAAKIEKDIAHKASIEAVKDALKLQADMSNLVSGALKEYETDSKSNAKTIADTEEAIKKLVETQGTGLTALQLAGTEQGNYTTKLGEMNTKLQEAKDADIALQTQIATRLMEGLVLREIVDAAENGLDAAEIERIKATATALGVADSDAVQGSLNTEIAATALADARAKYADAFETENTEGMAQFKAFTQSIASDITNGVEPDMAKAGRAADAAGERVKALVRDYDRLQSKDITIKITTITVAQSQTEKSFEQKGVARGVVAAGALAGDRAAGGPVMGAAGTYLVGEMGPELFNPAGNGTIIPNSALGGMGGGSLRIGTINLYGVQSASELFNQLSKEARARGLQFAAN